MTDVYGSIGGAGTGIAPGGAAHGGAIFVSDGLVRLTNCSVTLNKVLGGRGGQALILTDANVGGDAAGAGGSARNSDVVLIDGEIAGNVAEGGEAGAAPGSRRGGHARGGGWEQIGGNAGFTRTLFLTNTAVGARPVASFSAVVPGTDAVGGGLVVETGISVLEDVILQGNQALGGDSLIQGRGMGAGGAIVNSGSMELRRAVIRSNAAIAGVGDFNGEIAFGGAIYNLGSLSLRECLVQSNTVSNGKTPEYFGIPTGGALWNGGTVTLLNSALDANVATNQRPRRAFGGAIYNTGQVFGASVTVCRNIASAGIDRSFNFGQGGDAFGGGIYQSGGLMALTNVTIASNAAVGSWLVGSRLGENLNIAGGSLFLRNSIITGSGGGGGGGSNCVGVVTDGGHNISSDGSCKFAAAGSLNNTDPKVGPVANYGGSTPTLALLYESPALDSGDAAGCPATDQRGRLRPFGSGCDIGAFESSPPYTIFGSVSGAGDLPTGVRVFVDGSAAAVEPGGTYLRSGLAPGTHFIVPASSAAIFFPSNAVVDLGTDRMENFYWYHSNKVTLEINSPPGTHRFIYVGQTGQMCRLMGSSNLVDWFLLKSDVVNSSGMFSHEEPDVGPSRRRFYNLELP